MPRYFFDLSGSSAPKDILGIELADDATARQEAEQLDTGACSRVQVTPCSEPVSV